MAITLNDNIKVNAPKPVESKYLNGQEPRMSVPAVNSAIAKTERYLGLTVNIDGAEYWYKDGINNADLVPKTLSHISGEPTGTGAISNIVRISESNYDVAEGAGNLNLDTVYLITD